MEYNKMPYENVVSSMFGSEWRRGSVQTLNGAWGVAIVKAVIDGAEVDLNAIANHLGVDRRLIRDPFTLLALNGVFMQDKIQKDYKEIKNNGALALGYYAGYAAGLTGPFDAKIDIDG